MKKTTFLNCQIYSGNDLNEHQSALLKFQVISRYQKSN